MLRMARLSAPSESTAVNASGRGAATTAGSLAPSAASSSKSVEIRPVLRNIFYPRGVSLASKSQNGAGWKRLQCTFQLYSIVKYLRNARRNGPTSRRKTSASGGSACPPATAFPEQLASARLAKIDADTLGRAGRAGRGQCRADPAPGG